MFRNVARATIPWYSVLMFRSIKIFAATLQALTSAIVRLERRLEEVPREDPESALHGEEIAMIALKTTEILARIDDLEQRRAIWEAEMDAQLVKADSKYKSARNAEERARKLGTESYEADEGDLPSEEEIQQAYADLGIVPPGDAEGGDSPGVLAMRESLEGATPKASALRAKFGG